ncbi:MAG: Fic family protein [Anaerolineales bacterium]|nr:Fic family protein [Anaerolineales bacterium]
MDYLAELMTVFPVEDSEFGSVEDAESLLQLRYQALLDTLVDSKEILKRLRSIPDGDFPSLFGRLTKSLHRTLFRGILSNAGNYRQSTEPNGGIVYFGGQKGAQPRFTGTPASEIEQVLHKVFRHLSKSAHTPVVSAVIFYQQFVRVHPFYDANGRICRLLVSLYLDYHRCYVNWDDLQRQGKWIRKLNACHDRQHQPELYNEYLGYLVAHFSNYVSDKADFEPRQTSTNL